MDVLDAKVEDLISKIILIKLIRLIKYLESCFQIFTEANFSYKIWNIFIYIVHTEAATGGVL